MRANNRLAPPEVRGVNGLHESWTTVWGCTVSTLSFVGAWFINHVDLWLALVGLVVGVLTAMVQYRTWRLRKLQINSCAPLKPPE